MGLLFGYKASFVDDKKHDFVQIHPVLRGWGKHCCVFSGWNWNAKINVSCTILQRSMWLCSYGDELGFWARKEDIRGLVRTGKLPFHDSAWKPFGKKKFPLVSLEDVARSLKALCCFKLGPYAGLCLTILSQTSNL